MATITHTDYLLAAGVPGLWVRLRNNSTSTDYFASAVTDALGAFTHSAPPGDYSLYWGTAATVPGTPNLRSSHYAVPVTAGDDIAAGSYSALASSPYAPSTMGAGYTDSLIADRGGQLFNVLNPTYGAKGNGQTVSDGAMSTGSAILTSASNKFVAADVAKTIVVLGGGAAGIPLRTTIASYQSAGQVTLTAANASGGNISGKGVVWGNDDGPAIAAAITAAAASGGGKVFLPATSAAGVNIYLIDTGITINKPGINLESVGSAVVTLYYTNSGDCIRTQMSPFSNFSWPGPQGGFTVDGTYAQSGACGVHYGDAVNGIFDQLKVANFQGGSPLTPATASKGIWMDNRTNWCERSVWNVVNAYHNTINVLFDVNGGNVSFAHTYMFNCSLDISPPNPSIGILLQNGAALVNSLIHITGNADAGATIIKLLDTATLGYATAANVYSITMESAAACTGFNFAVGTALFGAGSIDLSIGPMTSINASAGNIQYLGHFNCPGIYTMAGEGGVAMQGLTIPTGSLTMSPGTTVIGTLAGAAGNNAQFGFFTDAANSGNYWQMTAAGNQTQLVARGGGTLNVGPKVAAYNGTNTAGVGFPAIYQAPAPLTGQTAAVASVAALTSPNDGAKHTYMVSGFVTITTLGSGSFNLQVSYTDSNGTARTCNIPLAAQAGTFGALANTADDYKGTVEITVNPNTAVTIKTAGTFTGCTYNVGGNIKQVL